MDRYGTLSQTLAAVEHDGYSASFKFEDDGLRCLETDRIYEPTSMTIVDHYRFEGASNPDDTSVLYLLECSDGTKGTLIDAYGAYAAPGLAEFIKELPLDEADPAH